MSSTIKNILIFVAIAAVLILAYFFFFKPSSPTANLTSTSASSTASSSGTPASQTPAVGSDFLTILLNLKNMKLDDSIFSDPAFLSLHDSSVLLISDPTQEGRPNPFAPIGSDTSSSVSSSSASINALNTIVPVTSTGTGATNPPANPPAGSSTTGLKPTP